MMRVNPSSLFFNPPTVQTLLFGSSIILPKEIKMKNLSVAVILQCRKGFEEEFARCKSSLQKAGSDTLGIKIFTHDYLSREEILLQYLKEIKKFDYVTFVDASDYVGEYFFSGIPSVVDENTILSSECFTTQLCEGLAMGRVMSFAGTYKGHTPIYEDGYCLLDGHVWGYFYPTKMFKDSFVKFISKNIDEIGSLTYWAYFTKNKNLRVRLLPNSRYYHMIVREAMVLEEILTSMNYETYVKANPQLRLALELNPDFKIEFVNVPGFIGEEDDTNLIYSTSWVYKMYSPWCSLFTNITDFIEISKVGGFTTQESRFIRKHILDNIKESYLDGKLAKFELEEFKKLLKDDEV